MVTRKTKAMRKPTRTSRPRRATVENVAEVPWRQFPDHFGGALSKPLIMPETKGSVHLDHRISCYQPMAYVAPHTHKVQEQVYHLLEGEGTMEIAGKRRGAGALGAGPRPVGEEERLRTPFYGRRRWAIASSS